ncbi:hypothetical protein A3860_11090 [Niastella vici]|uniref:Uncharacterized protein n=1 Tax=Niastella vici TaxID=1703345 RepID=A0A1V9FFG0_9BACT|nr:hypothetical protein [Niastella vici]OQP57102.1 hypothetical protein A3860_11090 [Niastella vici]
MRKLISFLLILLPRIMTAQNSNKNNLNAPFDQLILADQKRKTVKVTGIDPAAVVFVCSDSIPKYTAKMELGDGILKAILESPTYSESSKIQFIKDVLADTVGDGARCFNFESCNFWRSSKEATALINAYFDGMQFEKSTQAHLRYRKLKFMTQSLYPESYQMIVDYFKSRPNLDIKYHEEADLVYWLVQMGKDEEALDYLQILVDDLIHDRVKYLSLGSRYGIFEKGNLFDHLCLSENGSTAKRATDLLFQLLLQKDFETTDLYKLTYYLDKDRHAQMLAAKNIKKEKIMPVFLMPEEKINSLVADLNKVAVSCDLPEIRLNKLMKFEIAIKHQYGVIHDFFRANNLLIGFYREDGDVPTNYVKLFEDEFKWVVKAQGCNHFTIGQVTKSINKDDYHYSLFVKYNKSIYKLGYSEEGTHDYNDMQRLIKLLNLCLIDNKEKKRFVGMPGEAFYEYVLMEPAIVMPLSKKYNLEFFPIDEKD